MDHDGHRARRETQRLRRRRVVDLVHLLDLEEVIAGAEAPELPASPLAGLLGQGVRVAPFEAAMGFHSRKIVAARPPRSTLGNSAELGRRQRHAPAGADAGRHRGVEGVEEAFEARRDLRGE